MENKYALQMADITMQLFVSCQERELTFVSKHGLKIAEFRCLRHLLREDCQPIKVLGSAMNLTAGRMSRIIEDLHKRQFIHRSEEEKDRRIKVISLTKQGKELAETMEESYINMHREILSNLPEETYPDVFSSLQQLLTAMDEWTRKKNTPQSAAALSFSVNLRKNC